MVKRKVDTGRGEKRKPWRKCRSAGSHGLETKRRKEEQFNHEAIESHERR